MWSSVTTRPCSASAETWSACCMRFLGARVGVEAAVAVCAVGAVEVAGGGRAAGVVGVVGLVGVGAGVVVSRADAAGLPHGRQEKFFMISRARPWSVIASSFFINASNSASSSSTWWSTGVAPWIWAKADDDVSTSVALYEVTMPASASAADASSAEVPGAWMPSVGVASAQGSSAACVACGGAPGPAASAASKPLNSPWFRFGVQVRGEMRGTAGFEAEKAGGERGPAPSVVPGVSTLAPGVAGRGRRPQRAVGLVAGGEGEAAACGVVDSRVVAGCRECRHDVGGLPQVERDVQEALRIRYLFGLRFLEAQLLLRPC
mmetsp:Transcript_32244/g.113510  ORF Transcript_32244/g.113510 Transcript_32244/m.113510 type:complete len:319 (+) Transcript_32244:118-1074(+)